MSGFLWTKAREQAALLVAEDKQKDTEIAASLGITARTLERWKLNPEFAERVTSLVADFREAVRARGITDKRNRLAALDDRWARMQQVIAERANQHAEIEEIPSPAAGASSGLMVLTVRFLPGGGRVEEWAVDTGLLKEMREHEKQAAVEVGQWAEKHEHSGPNGGAIPLTLVDKIVADADSNSKP